MTIAQSHEFNRIKLQIEMLKGYLSPKARKYGFCVDGATTYLAVGTEIYYKIPSAKFLLDPKKIPKVRLIKIGFYKDLFKKSRRLVRVYRRKKIRGDFYAVFSLEGKQICIPADRLKNFGWKEAKFFGTDEFSPVFILDRGNGYDNGWDEVQGFVMPVSVSSYILTPEILQKLDKEKLDKTKKETNSRGREQCQYMI
jgi:hypothetical protein